MKSSRAVPLVLLTSVAASLIACREKPARYCVDAKNAVVDDDKCAHQKSNYPAGIGYVPYHYYYGGARGRVAIGTPLSGGSAVAPSAGFSTARGVMGSAGEAAAAHGSGHGGGE